MKDIGKNIKAVRMAKSMTQDELAEKLFVTRQTVSNYENGRSRPDIDTVIKLAEVMETDTNSILYGPPQSEDQKQKIKKLIYPTTLFAVFSVMYIILSIIFRDSSIHYELVLPKYLINMTLRPVVMFLLGWVLFSVVNLFCNWQLSNSRWLNVVKFILRIILVALIVIPLPLVIFTIISIIHTTLYTSTSLSMKLIPIFNRIMWFVVWLMMKHPLIYSLLGGLYRLVTAKRPE